MRKPTRSKQWKKHSIKGVIAVLLLGVLSVFAPQDASASVFNLPKMDVISDGGVTIGPEYTFVPKVTSETKLETFGSSLWRNTTWGSGDSRKFRSIELTNPTNRDSLKKKIGARYTKVGTYNGQMLDLKITLTGWSRYGDAGKYGTAAPVGNISFEVKNIAVSTQGYKYVDMTWEYVKTGTNTKVPVSGYFTFSDIDVNQGLQFSKTTSSNIRRFLIDNRNNRLMYKNVSGQYKIYDVEDNDIRDTLFDTRNAFTFLYSGISNFSISWMTDWSKTTRLGDRMTPGRYYYADTTNYAKGEYLFFVINKPVATDIPTTAKKTVNKTSGVKPGDTLTYKITHDVPQEDPKFYYSKYVFTDTVDKTLTNITAKVTDSFGRDVTSKFTKSISGNKVTLTAKSGTRSSKDFYGDTYNVTITGKIDAAKLKAAVGSASSYAIKNKGSFNVNGKTFNTNEVKTTVPKRTLTVRHIDDTTGAVIKTETEAMFDGQSYSKSPRTDLKKGGLTYKPTTTAAKKGTISGSNVTVDFRYTLPSMDVGIEKIQIFTNKASSNGLKTIVDLKQNFPTGSSSDDFAGAKVKLEVLDTSNSNKSVFSKVYDIEDIPDNLEFKLPTDYLTKNKKVNYDFQMTIPSGSMGLKVVTPSIKTHGYTASEKRLTAAAGDTIEETGVIKTEKGRTGSVVELKEQLTVATTKLDPQKTGYGFNTTVNTEYRNDLRNLVDVKTNFKLDSALIDSYLDLDYASSGDMTTIPMDRTIHTESSDDKRVTSKMELPKVYVEWYSGNLFTKKQVDEDDEHMTHDVKDGGRKIYVPVWAALGGYDYAFESDGPIGVNAVTFNVTGELDLTAYMFNHSDSPTADEDELLLHPLNSEDVPADWALGTPPAE